MFIIFKPPKSCSIYEDNAILESNIMKQREKNIENNSTNNLNETNDDITPAYFELSKFTEPGSF